MQASSGDGDVEQPPLFGKSGRNRLQCTRRARVLGITAGREDVDELLRSEQRPATAQVGPDAFLHTRDRDDVPLEALRSVRSHQPHTLGARRLRRQGVAGDLLAEQVVEEHVGPGLRQPVGESGGDVEERDDCVEIAVGGGRSGRA